jgi:hypothetical protein
VASIGAILRPSAPALMTANGRLHDVARDVVCHDRGPITGRARSFDGLGGELAQGAHEPDDRLIALGGKLIHLGAEVLCLVAQQRDGRFRRGTDCRERAN